MFEVVCSEIGAQNSIAGGGRYEISFPGKKQPICGVGFAVGMERLLLTQDKQAMIPSLESSLDCYLVSLGGRAKEENFKLAASLRRHGFSVLMDFEEKSMKAQMRTANNNRARFALIRGENELINNTITCKDMLVSKQFELSVKTIANELSDLLKKSAS